MGELVARGYFRIVSSVVSSVFLGGVVSVCADSSGHFEFVLAYTYVSAVVIAFVYVVPAVPAASAAAAAVPAAGTYAFVCAAAVVPAVGTDKPTKEEIAKAVKVSEKHFVKDGKPSNKQRPTTRR